MASGVGRRAPYWKRSTRRRSRRRAPVSRGPFNPHPSHTRVFTQQRSLIHQNGCNAGWFSSVRCNRQNCGAGEGIVACGHAAVVLCSAGVPWNQPGSGTSEAATKNRHRRRHVAESIVRERRSASVDDSHRHHRGAWAAPRVHRARVPDSIFMAIDKGIPYDVNPCTYYRSNQ